MKKICFVTSSLTGGGAERVLAQIASFFAESGKYSVGVVAYNNKKVDYVLSDKIEYHALKGTGFLSKLRDMRCVLKHYEYIVSFDYSICIRTFLSTLFLRKKHIMSERNNPKRNIAKRSVRWARSFVYKRAKKVVFQTEFARDYFSKSIRKKGVIIENPITIEKLPRKTETQTFKMIAVGRLEPQKNFEMLISAFEKFQKSNQEYSLQIFGRGSQKEYLQELIKQKGLPEKIVIRDFSNEIFKELASSDFYVASSNYEGISNSMLEALCIGLPVVITDCENGGEKMFVANGENGYLVNVGDVDGLAEKMLLIAEDFDLQTQLSKKALQTRERVDLQRVGAKWMQLVEDIEK